MGSIAVTPTTTATTIDARTTRWNRAASRGRTSLPHYQPKYCDIVYPQDSTVSSAAPKVHATNPTITNASPTLPKARLEGSATWERKSTPTPRGWKTTAAPAIRASDSSPPSGKPRYTLALFRTRSERLHFSSTAPDEKKNTSYGVMAAPNN